MQTVDITNVLKVFGGLHKDFEAGTIPESIMISSLFNLGARYVLCTHDILLVTFNNNNNPEDDTTYIWDRYQWFEAKPLNITRDNC